MPLSLQKGGGVFGRCAEVILEIPLFIQLRQKGPLESLLIFIWGYMETSLSPTTLHVRRDLCLGPLPVLPAEVCIQHILAHWFQLSERRDWYDVSASITRHIGIRRVYDS